jgi:hypothetical protein
MERNLSYIYKPERKIDLFLVDLRTLLKPRSGALGDVLRAILYSFLLVAGDKAFLVVLPDSMFSCFNNSTLSPKDLAVLKLMVRPGYIFSVNKFAC